MAITPPLGHLRFFQDVLKSYRQGLRLKSVAWQVSKRIHEIVQPWGACSSTGVVPPRYAMESFDGYLAKWGTTEYLRMGERKTSSKLVPRRGIRRSATAIRGVREGLHHQIMSVLQTFELCRETML